MTNPPSPQSKSKNPWSPTQISWLLIAFGVLPATILWVVNNRRLNAAQSRSTFVSVFAGLAAYLLISAHLLLIGEQDAQFWLFRLLSLVVTLVLAWQLFLSQRTFFARHRHSGGRTAMFWTPLLVGFLCLLVSGGGEVGIKSARTERDYREFDRMVSVLGKNGESKNAQLESFFNDFKYKYPDEKMTYWNLALLYERTGRIKQAKKELRGWLKLAPNDKEARTYLNSLEEE